MPTGCKSEYLCDKIISIASCKGGGWQSPVVLFDFFEPRVPGSNLKGGAEDLGSYEFSHFELCDLVGERLIEENYL